MTTVDVPDIRMGEWVGRHNMLCRERSLSLEMALQDLHEYAELTAEILMALGQVRKVRTPK